MKPSKQRLSEVCRQHTEAVVSRHVHELFKRLPMLSGFTCPGYTAGVYLYEKVMQSLLEFAEEHPGAAQLMRGRTFARTVHQDIATPTWSVPCRRTSLSRSSPAFLLGDWVLLQMWRARRSFSLRMRPDSSPAPRSRSMAVSTWADKDSLKAMPPRHPTPWRRRRRGNEAAIAKGDRSQ